ncbi:MAG: SPOR domain-containing protein [Deltaproteobacteria bacterium]|nr:SPOR domain-containing protein [Deltaproteobacteria bacterium]
MSIGDNLKGKNLIVVAAAALVLVIVLLVVFLPGSKKSTGGPEVISKRVKINLQDEAIPQTGETKSEPTPSKPAVKVDTPAADVKGVVVPSTPPIKIEVAENKALEARAPEKKQASSETNKRPASETKAEAEKKPKKAEPATEKNDTKAPHKSQQATVAKAPSRGAWALNVASFSNLPDAKNLRGRLKSAGYNSYITEFTKDSIRWYRVRVGFYQTRGDAVNIGKKIKQKFRVQTPWVVKPPKEEAAAYAG